MQNLFLATSVKDTTSLVLSQLNSIEHVSFQDFEVLLLSSFVTLKLIETNVRDGLPHLQLKVDSHKLERSTFEGVRGVNVFIIRASLLSFLSFDLCLILGQVQLCNVACELDVSDPRQELDHDLFLQVVYYSKLHRVFA